MRYCQKHRGMESAEEGICEVAGALLLASVDSSCTLVDVLVIEEDWTDAFIRALGLALFEVAGGPLVPNQAFFADLRAAFDALVNFAGDPGGFNGL